MSAIQARMQLTAVPSKNDSSNDSELGTAAHVGGGGGKVSGAINGKVKWELFESQGDLVCSANMTGKIIADENSGIEFSALGFFGRDRGSNQWRLTSGIVFKNGTGSLTQLSEKTGTMSGTFDMSTYEHDHTIDLGTA